MGGWYWIGVLVGVGAALGLMLGAAAAPSRVGLLIAGAVAVAAAAVLGVIVQGWDAAIGGALGAMGGAIGGGELARGTLQRGGTRGGTAALLGGGAVLIAALAFIPVLGYLEGVAVPALALRLRQRAGRRYAGLRTLAKD